MKAFSQGTMVERLRTLVGDNGWEYCILWKLSPDQRFLEWMGCCCYGAEASIENGGELFAGGSAAVQKKPCRDVIFQHPRTRACDALSEFPGFIPMDPSLGVYAQVLASNQPTWQTNLSDSICSHETVGGKTRVLVPLPGGLLVELFVSKHIAEDQQIIDFVMSQYNAVELYNQDNTDFLDHQHPNQDLDGCDYTVKNGQHAVLTDLMTPWNLVPPQPSSSTDHPNFPWDLSSADQAQLYSSQLNISAGANNGGDAFFDASAVPPMLFDSTIDNGAYQQSMLTTARCLNQSAVAESSVSREVLAGHEKEPVKQEGGRADSGSEGSDHGDDDDDARPVGRNGKRPHSKNLVAERKRRKKLNDRLYALRSLVPKITKMDRASILGDAIEYVMELQKQVKDLQDELEDESNQDDDQEAKQNGSNCKMEIANQNGISNHGMELNESPNSSRMVPRTSTKMADPMKQGHEPSTNDEKGQQMEPQVEVRQLEGNEFFLKVFCEHKMGGFVRLMEAMSSLGLEVTNANVTTYRGLVLNVFRVERRDNEMVQVDQVRDSLLELTRDPSGLWSEIGQMAANGGKDFSHQNHHDNHHLRRHHHHHHLSSHQQLHYLHHQA